MKWKFGRAEPLPFGKTIDDVTSSSSKSDHKTPTALPTFPGKDPDFGTSAIVKTFYEGKNSYGNAYDWVDYPPKQLNKKVAKSNDRVALKIYKIKDHEQETISGRTPLKIHALDVQSPVLVHALKDIVKDENVFLETTEIAKFMEPFKPLFFCYEKIMALYRSSETTGVLKEHLHLLTSVMDEIFGPFMSHLKHLRASGLMSFKLAWTYFPRESLVYCGAEDSMRVCRVVNTIYCERPARLSINCEEIAFDGDNFSWQPITLDIPAFPGNLPVNVLPNYPLSFHKDQEGVRARLTVRAKKVLEYQSLTYCDYSGVGILAQRLAQKHNVSSRILIDFFGYSKHFEGLERTENRETNLEGEPILAESSKDDSVYSKRLTSEKQEQNKREMLAREQDLIFVSPILKGFALNNKLWLKFYIDDIKSITWNDEAYSHLVYPEEQKDLVLTFVENHQQMKAGVDDVIMGKGQGLIILLSGPPGTGKTLTAEAVADKTRRPLYYLQAEDLGTNAAELGPKIKKVFEMATEWDAVILLDEADVFMAERSPADIERNELVSIFLRELEYFQGIIFLTTNLYSTIDVAFRSRVNIHLLFSPLPFDSRLVLWQKFLSRLPPGPFGDLACKLSDKDFEELAKWDLNGREIKNSIKTVRTWCMCKGFDMNLLRLESGIKVTAPQAKKEERK